MPSGSIEPTLLCGDRLWINKLAYGGRFPSRWADIPLLNVFTWIRPLRLADEENHWEYRRLPGYSEPKQGILRCSTARQIRNCCWSSELPGW